MLSIVGWKCLLSVTGKSKTTSFPPPNFVVQLGKKHVGRAVVLNAPLQHFLNAAFEAENATTNYQQALVKVTSQTNSMPESLLDLKRKATECNLGIISGQRGEAVLKSMEQLCSDFNSEGWQDLGLTHPEKFDMCGNIIVQICDAYVRLVLYYKQSKFEVFQVCRSADYCKDFVGQVTRNMVSRSEACPTCVDPFFGKQWLSRLQDVRTASKAHRTLCDMLPTLRVTSVRTEKKHLLGQETRLAKRRGRCLTVKELRHLCEPQTKNLSCCFFFKRSASHNTRKGFSLISLLVSV